jgi:hypothetical protein
MAGPVDPQRLAWLLEHRAAALEFYAAQFCRCAEDVVQEAVIELAALRERPQDDLAWLYGVVRHKALSAARIPLSWGPRMIAEPTRSGYLKAGYPIGVPPCSTTGNAFWRWSFSRRV